MLSAGSAVQDFKSGHALSKLLHTGNLEKQSALLLMQAVICDMRIPGFHRCYNASIHSS